jgi:CheY-like chemotaxis protein
VGDGEGNVAAEILLVEDEPSIREDLGALLADEGYSVLTARHGADALKLLESGARPGVILLDLMMPIMDGWELRARLRAIPRLASIPVVILSGAPLGETDAGLLEASACVGKPIRLNHLLNVLARLIRS